MVKRVVTTIIVVMVIIGLVAAYVFSGVAPVTYQPSPADSDQFIDQTPSQAVEFKGPTGDPFVNGPSASPTVSGPTE